MGDQKVRALLLDTRSIQRYIFAGTELKTNVGASYLVKQLFRNELKDVVQKLQLREVTDWEGNEDTFASMQDPAYCIPYVGGGNALLLFSAGVNQKTIEDVVTNLTKQLLVEAPGLSTGAAIGELDLGGGYSDSFNRLHAKLRQNQNTVRPQVNVPYTGLTHTCPVSGGVANCFRSSGKGNRKNHRHFSQETVCKEKASVFANQSLNVELAKRHSGFLFPMALDMLGQVEGENYIAIVHADGNQMGKRFSGCSSLGRHAYLSRTVATKTAEAFDGLIDSIVADIQKHGWRDKQNNLHMQGLVLSEEKNSGVYLPIRPIIIGGDDVTFVCAGRMALTYTKRFLEAMLTDVDKDKNIDCCAGVAILPTSYPFFRGYVLAEQLCGAAKKCSRGREGTAWMDFAILHGEQAPELEDIRLQEYHGAWLQNLHFGPYQVQAPETEIRALDKLFEAICALSPEGKSPREKAKLPARNTLKELRLVLQHGAHDVATYRDQLRHTGKAFPHVGGWDVYMNDLSDGKESPLVDVIEMMEFMPKQENVSAQQKGGQPV